MIEITGHDRNQIRPVLQVFAGLKEDKHGVDTPQRFLAMLDEVTGCRDCDGSCIKWKDFEDPSNDMVVVQQIPFASQCNHHVVPFSGFAHIGYVPDGKVAGLSKFARTVSHFAKQLQYQERMTRQIASYLQNQLEPAGLMVVLKAEHLCMTIRGAQAPGTITTTATTLGVFDDHTKTAKSEFLTYINGRH